MRGITIYSKKSGMEILGNDIIKKERKYGVVTLRFFSFKFEGVSPSMRFIMTPIEAFSASLLIKGVANSNAAIKKSLTHKFEKDGQEITTVLTFEKWAREGKSGYATVIQRDDQSINVPMDMSTFAYLGELLKYLSTQQAWVNPTETAVETTTAQQPEYEIIEEDDFTPSQGMDIFGDLDEPEPTPEPAAATNGNLVTAGLIEAVRKDKKGIKVGDSWFSLNEHTKLKTNDLARGLKVIIEYRNGNNGSKFANAVTAVA